MNAAADTDTLTQIITACFFGTWIVLGIAGFVLFYGKGEAAFKRRWFPRYVILAGILFVGFTTTLIGLQAGLRQALGMLCVTVPAVCAITYLNIKLTRFCDQCGATVIHQNPFSPARFCPKCGAKLATAKPDPLDEI